MYLEKQKWNNSRLGKKKYLIPWHWEGEDINSIFFCFSFLDKYDRYAAPNDRVVSVQHLPARVSLVERLAR